MNEIRLTVRQFIPRKGWRNRFRRFLSSILEPRGGWVRKIPGNWDELTRENLMFLAEFYPYPNAYNILNQRGIGLDLEGKVKLHLEKVKARRFLTYLFTHFFGIRKNWRLMLWTWIFLGAEELLDILYAATGQGEKTRLFDFIFDAPSCKAVRIDRFQHKGNDYVGPMDRWQNMVNDEFALADGCFVSYLKEPDPDTLLLLVATLYRPEHPTMGRAPFNRLQVDNRKAELKDLPQKLQLAILLNYMAVRNYVINANPHVFKSGSSGSAKRRGWGDVVLSMAKDQMEAASLKTTMIWDTFRWLKELRDRPKPKTK